MRRLRDVRRDERGTTLIELLVATAAGMTLFLGMTIMVLGAMHTTNRVKDRVHDTQNARTVVHRIVSQLHSSCVARYLTPIMKESSGTDLRFVRSYSSQVSPTPVETRVTLSGTTLTESEYAVLSGSSPEWNFQSTPFATTALMTNVAAVPGVPIFSYYRYKEGVISTTRETVPLTERTGEGIVKVDIELQITPPKETVTDAHASATIQDSALLRFTPPTYSTTGTNLPCE